MVGLSSGVTIWVLCLLSWKLTTVTSQPIETGSDNSFSGHGRYKRSMPTVLEKLLSGAKLLMNNGDYKLFSRPGGYAKAKADFEALGLTNIRQSKLGVEGRVEDRTVMLRYSDTMSGYGVIDIMKAAKLRDGFLEPSEINRIRYPIQSTHTRL